MTLCLCVFVEKNLGSKSLRKKHSHQKNFVPLRLCSKNNSHEGSKSLRKSERHFRKPHF